MVGPANGVSNYLALEKIYCALILQIRAFWPPELRGQKTITSQRWGGGGHGHPRTTPSNAWRKKEYKTTYWGRRIPAPWFFEEQNKMDVQKSEIRIDLKMFSQEPTVDLTLDFSRDIPSGGGGWGGYLFAGYTHLNKYWPFDQSDYEYEILSILSARTRTSVILAGKRGSRRHSTTSFSENVEVAETSYQMLQVFSFFDQERV